jgi:hypothetical protein
MDMRTVVAATPKNQRSSIDARVIHCAISSVNLRYPGGPNVLSHKQDHRFAFTQADTGYRRTRYRLVVVEPSLARAALCSDGRIYQHL